MENKFLFILFLFFQSSSNETNIKSLNQITTDIYLEVTIILKSKENLFQIYSIIFFLLLNLYLYRHQIAQHISVTHF